MRRLFPRVPQRRAPHHARGEKDYQKIIDNTKCRSCGSLPRFRHFSAAALSIPTYYDCKLFSEHKGTNKHRNKRQRLQFIRKKAPKPLDFGAFDML